MTYNTARRKPLRGAARQAFLEAHDCRCYFCGQPITDDKWDDEHVLARELGGTDDMDNRRPIHRVPCHRTKTAQDRKLIAKGNRIRQKISGLQAPSTRKRKPVTRHKDHKWPYRPVQSRAK